MKTITTATILAAAIMMATGCERSSGVNPSMPVVTCEGAEGDEASLEQCVQIMTWQLRDLRKKYAEVTEVMRCPYDMEGRLIDAGFDRWDEVTPQVCLERAVINHRALDLQIKKDAQWEATATKILPPGDGDSTDKSADELEDEDWTELEVCLKKIQEKRKAADAKGKSKLDEGAKKTLQQLIKEREELWIEQANGPCSNVRLDLCYQYGGNCHLRNEAEFELWNRARDEIRVLTALANYEGEIPPQALDFGEMSFVWRIHIVAWTKSLIETWEARGMVPAEGSLGPSPVELRRMHRRAVREVYTQWLAHEKQFADSPDVAADPVRYEAWRNWRALSREVCRIARSESHDGLTDDEAGGARELACEE